ncbi:uncharacterized protein LOC143353855 [Halictus rubicundus]|uniref:uncharacterized protein LOC143353855 n=1 Tax=Halictus rubicundus TaxID=77578 RepID=UPI004035725E
MTCDRSDALMKTKSEIAEFYNGATVLVTGGTGFLGKLLIEKLLRSCPDVKTIYMMIRPKKGKSVEERFKENFQEVIYDRLKREQPNFMNKIVMIEGDAAEEDFGLTPEVKATLMDTNIVFHAAATVRFDEKLRVAVNINVRTTKCLLLWAKQLPNLKAFIYVSTAFSYCVNKTIDEIHYQPPIESDKLIKLIDCLDDDKLLAAGPILLQNFPNNYIFTKAAAENVVLKFADDFPVGIVRPSVVTSTANEPTVSWINNYYGATGVSLVASIGLMHTIHCVPECKAEIIPADYVIANIVAAAWDVGNRKAAAKLEQKPSIPDEERIPIYNSVTSPQNPLNWKTYMRLTKQYGILSPSVHIIWYYMLWLNRYFIVHQICAFFLHTVPAYIVDTIAPLMGQKPILVDAYRKMGKFSSVIHYFSTLEWDFRNENVQKMWSKLNATDRKLFNFNVADINWDNYLKHNIRGIRIYLLNDPLDQQSVEKGLLKFSRVLSYGVKITSSHNVKILSPPPGAKEMARDINEANNSLDLFEPHDSENNERSEIAEFYSGTNVFVTGGTGFIGKLLIEKLLRSCPRITKVYMLVRPKKGKSPEERFKENFEEVVYDRLRKEQPNFLSKIVMIQGDASEEDFGMTPEVKTTLTDTNIIFHAAATVRFDVKLRVGVNTNVRTTKCLLLWARQLPNLKGFVYVSTAFSNCVDSTVDEIHYKNTIEADKLITLANCLNDDQLLAMEPILRGKVPNNYILSKAAAENAVLKYGDGLPVAIVRPSIVIPTSEEPIRAWINNFYGITGLIAGASVGLLRAVHVKLHVRTELIPADYVVANVIAAAWDIGTRDRTTKLEEDSIVCDEEKIPIYNSVSSTQNPLHALQYLKWNKVTAFAAPPTKAVWYFVFICNSYSYSYQITSFFLHTIPGIIGDTILRLLGQKPMLMDAYRKIHKFMDVMQYFTTQHWNFRNDNVQKLWSKLNSVDRKIFNFNVANLDWQDYFQYHWRGVRVYLLNDPLDNVEQAHVRYNKLQIPALLAAIHPTHPTRRKSKPDLLLPLILASWYKNKMKISEIHKMSKPLDSLEPQVSRSYEKSEVAEFYAGTTVLITGGTGFLGKLLIEKLLRSCPRITKIYMLVRSKKGKSPEERFKENFEEVIYDRLRKEQPNFLSKIVMIEGDASEEDFGMTPEVKTTLTDTNIIFHAAATVRFDEKLRVGVNTNVRTTKCLLLWARQLPNLKGFVYVSTAFSNCVDSTVDEIHNKHTIEADKLITLVNCLNDDQLLAMEPILRGKVPNNYILSKAAAENAVLKYGVGLPVAIVRPSIVIPTSEEPIRAWINNFYGITGFIAGATNGIIRTLYGKIYNKVEIIPADYVVANIVAAAWDIGTRPFGLNLVYITSENFYLYKIESFVLHTIPGIIGDTILRLMGQKPMLMDAYRKIHKFMDVMQYFSMNEWDFRNENVKKLWSKLNSVDRKLFNFNVANLDWQNYFQYHWRGVRVYLLNDPLDNVEQAHVRYNKLRMLHYTVLAIFLLLVLWIAVLFVSFLWS